MLEITAIAPGFSVSRRATSGLLSSLMKAAICGGGPSFSEKGARIEKPCAVISAEGSVSEDSTGVTTMLATYWRGTSNVTNTASTNAPPAAMAALRRLRRSRAATSPRTGPPEKCRRHSRSAAHCGLPCDAAFPSDPASQLHARRNDNKHAPAVLPPCRAAVICGFAGANHQRLRNAYPAGDDWRAVAGRCAQYPSSSQRNLHQSNKYGHACMIAKLKQV